MAAPKLKTTAAPVGPQRVLRSSGPAPVSKLKLKGSDGKVIQPKAAPAPAPETPGTPVDPEAQARAEAEAAAAAAAAEEEARKAQEEYEKQMEEYNRQMEEYNRQMEAIKAEEEARAKAEEEARRAEEEARRAEEEARAKAEAEARAKAEAEARVLAEIEAKLQAEEDAKRRAEEEARAKAEEEKRLKEEFEAQLRAEAEARLIADKEAKLKAAAEARAEEEIAQSAVKNHESAVAALRARVEAEADAQAKADLEAKLQEAEAAKAAAVQAAAAAHEAANKASAEALAAARAAASVAPKPAPAPAPARKAAEVPKTSLPKASVPKTSMKVAGLSPATPKVAGLTPAMPKGAVPKTSLSKPAAEAPATTPKATEVPKTSMPKPAGLTPAAPKGADVPKTGMKVAGLSPATPKLGVPKTSLPKTTLPKAAAAPAAAEAPAEEAPAPAAAKPKLAPKPLGAAGPKPLGAKRPGAAAPALGKPRVAATPVPAPAAAEAGDAPVAEDGEPLDPNQVPEEVPAEPTEEEIARREEQLAALQAAASKPPFWKSPGFLMGAGFLVALSAVCGYFIVSHQNEQKSMKAYADKINGLLIQAQELNKNRVEKLADAKSKNINIRCSKEDAEALLAIVVNPKMKKDDGTNILGPDSKVVDVAYNACILLCLAAEQDAEICKMVFDTLAEECNNKTFEPRLFKFMVGHLAATDIKGINKKLKTLVKEVGKKSTIKGTEVKWSKKGHFASSLWEVIGLRVSEKDLPEIIEVLKDDSCDAQVIKTMAVVLDNIFQMDTKDAAKRSKLGDQLFDGLPGKLRTNRNLVPVLGRSGSAKALDFFKGRSAADTKNWDLDCMFYGRFTGSNIIPYLQELKGKAGGDAKKEMLVEGAIGGILGQNRDRTDAEAEELITLVFGDKLKEDTSQTQRLIELTDTDGVNFEKDEAKRKELKAQLDGLLAKRREKIKFINTLACMHDHGWVVKQLNKMAQDKDEEVSYEAKSALDKVKKNRQDEAARQAKFNSKKQAD